MTKMGLGSTIEALEVGYVWPGTSITRAFVPLDDLKKYGLRKPKKEEDADYYSLWVLGVGEAGQQLTYFYGFTLIDAAKKAYEWKSGGKTTP